MTTQQAVRIQGLERITDLERVVRLLCEVWETDTPVDLINASTLRALVDAESYVVGVVVGEDEMVGAAVAVRGREHIHSHIVGIHPKQQGNGLGYLLKQDEAEWARSQGYQRIRWTYDPLVRRNAYFNLAKLHTRVLGYEDNYYGELKDGLNDNDETDRLVIEWDFEDGAPVPVSAPVDADSWDFIRHPEAVLTLDDGVHRLVPTPADIEDLRLHDPERARAWRCGVRAGFHRAFAEGYAVTGFNADGWYVLRRR